jgi:hypothetical protein
MRLSKALWCSLAAVILCVALSSPSEISEMKRLLGDAEDWMAKPSALRRQLALALETYDIHCANGTFTLTTTSSVPELRAYDPATDDPERPGDGMAYACDDHYQINDHCYRRTGSCGTSAYDIWDTRNGSYVYGVRYPLCDMRVGRRTACETTRRISRDGEEDRRALCVPTQPHDCACEPLRLGVVVSGAADADPCTPPCVVPAFWGLSWRSHVFATTRLPRCAFSVRLPGSSGLPYTRTMVLDMTLARAWRWRALQAAKFVVSLPVWLLRCAGWVVFKYFVWWPLRIVYAFVVLADRFLSEHINSLFL